MKLWIARDEGAAYCYIFTTKPEKRYSHFYECEIWTTHRPNHSMSLDVYDFPEVTFENSPMEVELVLKKCYGGVERGVPIKRLHRK